MRAEAHGLPGSRLIVCRNREAALRRFGVTQDEIGVCYTRTGRRFFNEDALERDFLARVQAAVGAAGLWDEFNTDWVCLDCELMPWSSKAQELLVRQYAPAGAAGRAGLREAVVALRTSSARLPELGPIAAPEYEVSAPEWSAIMLRRTVATVGRSTLCWILSSPRSTYSRLRGSCIRTRTTCLAHGLSCHAYANKIGSCSWPLLIR